MLMRVKCWWGWNVDEGVLNLLIKLLTDETLNKVQRSINRWATEHGGSNLEWPGGSYIWVVFNQTGMCQHATTGVHVRSQGPPHPEWSWSLFNAWLYLNFLFKNQTKPLTVSSKKILETMYERGRPNQAGPLIRTKTVHKMVVVCCVLVYRSVKS